jgi:hypothetical protein
VTVRLTICWLCAWCLFRSFAADPKESGTNLIRQINANTLQIGEVRLETKEHRLIIPATVNMVEGPIEYVLVSAIGKLHESIFKTTAEPMHIQTAALLLMKAPGPTNRPPLLRVKVELSPAEAFAAEELIENTKPEARLKPGNWRYNGSRVVDGTFIAQRDGSIIAIIADPDSLIESGRVPADDDENWRPRKANLPPVGTAVQMILSFGPTN